MMKTGVSDPVRMWDGIDIGSLQPGQPGKPFFEIDEEARDYQSSQIPEREMSDDLTLVFR